MFALLAAICWFLVAVGITSWPPTVPHAARHRDLKTWNASGPLRRGWLSCWLRSTTGPADPQATRNPGLDGPGWCVPQRYHTTRGVDMMTLGATVLYKLSDQDVREISQRAQPTPGNRNPVNAGDTYPAMVVRAWGSTAVNLQVFLDGDCSHWATSRVEGDEPGQWSRMED